MQENLLKVGDLCKHFKGETLMEKNIYKILAIGVKYSGDKVQGGLNNLIVYENIFQNNKIFTREYEDFVQEIDKEKQELYHQKYRVEPLSKEEIEMVCNEQFRKEKLNRN